MHDWGTVVSPVWKDTVGDVVPDAPSVMTCRITCGMAVGALLAMKPGDK